MKNFLPTLFIIGIIAFVGVSLTEQGSQRASRSTQTNTNPSLSPSPTGKSLTAVNDDLTDIKCDGEPTIALTEGPYYKEGSPERINIRDDADEEGESEDVEGEILTLSGYALDTDCEPIQNAWLDFWQADSEGNYDNEGYGFRGHQYTDTNGFYILETVIPAQYSGRTPHIHVKLRALEESPIITTQLFLPDAEENNNDSIFDESLVIDLTGGEDRVTGSYNFILDTNL